MEGPRGCQYFITYFCCNCNTNKLYSRAIVTPSIIDCFNCFDHFNTGDDYRNFDWANLFIR